MPSCQQILLFLMMEDFFLQMDTELGAFTASTKPVIGLVNSESPEMAMVLSIHLMDYGSTGVQKVREK